MLRETWKVILLVMWDSLAIQTIIVAYIIFFAIIGFLLFDDKLKYNDEAAYFPDISISIFNMYVLFTLSNFPDIIFPFYKVDNITSVFFMSFIFVGLYLLLNLMLAVFYNSYRRQINGKIAKYEKMR